MSDSAEQPDERLAPQPPERLARMVECLLQTGSFRVFAAFVRRGDVRRWIRAELRLADEDYAAALVDLDNRQAEFLPEKIDDIAPRTQKRLRAIFEFVKVQLRKKGLRGVLHGIARHALPATNENASAATPLSRLPFDLPRIWKLRLPIPPAIESLDKISPTRLDSYLRCPFTFFLNRKDILGDKRLNDRASELARWEYGNLAHEALEHWALSPLRNTADVVTIRDFLATDVDRQLAERFGASIPPAVVAQRESVCRRLALFAECQAEWFAEGWRILAVERKLEGLCGHTRLYGKCDRIDRNERTGQWCVIDYKTWDSSEKAERSYAVQENGFIVWNSLQLPLYCALLADNGDPLFADATRKNISSRYCVLGKTAADVRFTRPISGELVPAAELKAGELIGRIERGLFWPPSPRDEWRHDFEDWLFPSPAETVDEDWIADQEKRKEKTVHGP